MSETAAVPLSVVIPEELNEHLGLLFPLGLDAFLDRILYEDMSLYRTGVTDEEIDEYEGTLGVLLPVFGLRFGVYFRGRLAQSLGVGLQLIDGLELVIGAGRIGIDAEVDLEAETFRVALTADIFRLRFGHNLLQPVVSEQIPDPNDPTGQKKITVFKADKTRLVELAFPVTLSIDEAGEIEITWPENSSESITLPPSMIGDTGIVVQGNLGFDFSTTSALQNVTGPAKDPAWMGLVIRDFKLYLPPDMAGIPPGQLSGSCLIGSRGFSANIKGSWVDAAGKSMAILKSSKQPDGSDRRHYEGAGSFSLFGLPAALHSVELVFEDTVPVHCEIEAEFLLPYFDEPVAINLGLGLDGSIHIGLRGADSSSLLVLQKQDVLELRVETLAFQLQGGIFTALLSGEVTPLFGKTRGLNWPSFDVNKLAIDSNGNVHLDGGWLTLRKQKPLNFYGFQVEITRLGFGKTEDGGKWIGFSGGVKLVEGLPAGASVEGLRIVWYDDGSKPPSVTFNGVGVEFQVPDVLTFKGSVAYSGLVELTRPDGVEKIQRFDGDIKLKLVALNMEIDAALVIGSASGPRGNYTFFAFYLGVELPAGIPLFSTGVALYGMAGLFATQMEPNKRENEGWYENPNGDPGWYKRDTPGVTDLKNKWDPRQGSLAFGVGVTLGTLPDHGTSFHGKFLLVIVFPGPIVLLEGRGDLLKKRASADKPGATTIVEEPLFRALAVLDNRVGTFTIGLDAQYKYNEKGALIDIRGGAETFFSFRDANAWHLYVGRDEPVEQRIHALFFKNLFEANAYFMLDPSSVRTGAWMGIGKSWIFGPLVVKLEAFIDGKAVLSRRPEHFYGHLLLHGNVGLTVFGFGATLNLDAECNADVFDPFHVRFDFHVGIDLPWFLPDFDVDFSKEWGPEPVPPPLPLPLQEIAVEHLKVTTKWPLPRDGNQPLLLPNYDSDNDGFLNPSTGASQPPDFKALPVVPLDSRPHITFGRAMNDDALVGVNVQPGNGVWERIGDPSQNRGPVLVRYGLTGLALHKWDPGTGTWKLVARKGKTGTSQDDMLVVPPLYGSWAPVPSETGSDGTGGAQTKLWLWSKNPFDYTRHSGRAWDEWFTSQFPNYPCVPPAPDREICCDVAGIDPGRLSPPQWQCPDHPEMSISWVAPDGSIHPDEATITLPQGSKGVKITLSQEHVGHVRRCINFAQYPTGPGSNPRIERRVSFEVLIPDPTTGQLIPAPQTRVTIPTGVAVGGLDCGFVLEITLPRPCFLVEMTLTSQRGSTRVEAFNADKSALS